MFVAALLFLRPLLNSLLNSLLLDVVAVRLLLQM